MFVSPISLCLLVLHPLAVGGGVGSATRPAGALQKAMLKKRGASSVAVEVAMDGDGSDTAAAVGGNAAIVGGGDGKQLYNDVLAYDSTEIMDPGGSGFTSLCTNMHSPLQAGLCTVQ